MAYLFDGCLDQATDNNGNPISGALMYIYLAGTTTLTPSYTDETAAVQNTNPVVADSTGRWPPVYFEESIPVRVKATNVLGSYTLYDVDYVSPPIPDSFGDLEDAVAEVVSSLHWGLFADWDSSPPTIPAAITSIESEGYGAQGLGIARYIYDAAVNSAYVTAWPRSSFLAADGRGFRIDPKQMLHIEMWGGKADCPVTNQSPYNTGNWSASGAALTGTDNHPAMMEAAKYAASYITVFVQSTMPIHFYGGEGNFLYRVGQSFVVPRVIDFRGLAGGQDTQSGTGFKFPANTKGFDFFLGQNNPNGLFGTEGSRLSNLYIYGSGGSDRTKHGIHYRSRVNLNNVVVDSFSGTSYYCLASVGYATSDDRFGLASGSMLFNCSARFSGNWGFWTEGADTSASTFIGCNTRMSRVGGIYEGSSFCNTYIACNAHDYGNARVGAVHRSGRLYVLIDKTSGIGSSTTPGTNNTIWYDVGAGVVSTVWPEWSGAATYELSVPIFATGSSNYSRFTCSYVEIYYPCHIESTCNAKFDGGLVFATRYSKAETGASSIGESVYNTRGVGGYRTYSPTHSSLGDYFMSAVGGGDGTILEHRQQSDGDSSWKWEYSGKDTYYTFGGTGSGRVSPFFVLGPSSAETLGSGGVVTDLFGVHGIAIGTRGGSHSAAPIVASGTAAPASGRYSRGSIVINSGVTAAGQTSYWQCTVAGAPGTWVAKTL